jgi:hypothetical protein
LPQQREKGRRERARARETETETDRSYLHSSRWKVATTAFLLPPPFFVTRCTVHVGDAALLRVDAALLFAITLVVIAITLVVIGTPQSPLLL